MAKKSGSDVFIESLNSLVNEDDMNAVLNSQRQMLERFEKTNEMLSKFNQLSANQYETVSTQLKGHTALLLDMRKDIDGIFRRIRFLKTKLATEYPEAFKFALENIDPHEPQEVISSIQQTPTTGHQQEVLLDIKCQNEDDIDQGSGLHNIPSIN